MHKGNVIIPAALADMIFLLLHDLASAQKMELDHALIQGKNISYKLIFPQYVKNIIIQIHLQGQGGFHTAQAFLPYIVGPAQTSRRAIEPSEIDDSGGLPLYLDEPIENIRVLADGPEPLPLALRGQLRIRISPGI